jgi:hypothetical protein
LFDSNLSPALAKALHELSIGDQNEVYHLRDRFAEDTEDHVWIAALGDEGNWSIVSQDRFAKGSLEKEALRQSGITTFVLASGWSKLTHWEKAWRLVRWWPRIMDMAAIVESGAYVVPLKVSGAARLKPFRP